MRRDSIIFYHQMRVLCVKKKKKKKKIEGKATVKWALYCFGGKILEQFVYLNIVIEASTCIDIMDTFMIKCYFVWGFPLMFSVFILITNNKIEQVRWKYLSVVHIKALIAILCCFLLSLIYYKHYINIANCSKHQACKILFISYENWRSSFI